MRCVNVGQETSQKKEREKKIVLIMHIVQGLRDHKNAEDFNKDF